MIDRSIQLLVVGLTIIGITVAIHMSDKFHGWRRFGYAAGAVFVLLAGITLFLPEHSVTNGPTIAAPGDGNCNVAGNGNHVSCSPVPPPAKPTPVGPPPPKPKSQKRTGPRVQGDCSGNSVGGSGNVQNNTCSH